MIAIPRELLLGGAAAILIAIGVWRYGRDRYDAGVADERVRWEQVQAKASAEAAKRTASQREAVEKAGTRATRSIAGQDRETIHYVEKVREVYRDRDDPLCIDDLGVRLIAEADRARAAADSKAASRSDD